MPPANDPVAPEVAGDVETLLASHYQVTGPLMDEAALPADWQVISASHTNRQSTLLVRSEAPIAEPGLSVDQIGLEDLVLAYMSYANRRPARDAAPAVEVNR